MIAKKGGINIKLYNVCFSTIRHGDPSYLIVAENEKGAIEKAQVEFDKTYGYSFREDAYEINEIDGYKIVFKKGKKISLEKYS
jgi:hypothetical protein